jgi:hypothetical protein
MAQTRIDLPRLLIERIEAFFPANAMFVQSDSEDWPRGALSSLINAGLLLKAPRAASITCPGCEWQCSKPVVTRQTSSLRGQRAFIVCNEAPDFGRIPISSDALRRFQMSMASISRHIARQLGFKPTKVSVLGASCYLGAFKGRNGSRALYVKIDDGRAILEVGRQAIGLAEALLWTGNDLRIDEAELRRMANRKDLLRSPAASHVADKSRQKARSEQTRKRDRAIYREALALQKVSGASFVTISEQLADRQRVGTASADCLTAGRIRRIITEMRSGERKKKRPERKDRK